MKLEVGKCYLTRDGRNTGPLISDGKGDYLQSPNIKQAVWPDNLQIYNLDGSVAIPMRSEKGHVIVAEWVEFEVGRTYHHINDSNLKVVVDHIGTNKSRAYGHSFSDPSHEIGINAEDGWILTPVVVEQVKNVFRAGDQFMTTNDFSGDSVGHIKFTLTDGKLSVEVVE